MARKSTESKLVALQVLGETDRAIRVSLLAITATGGETSVTEWLPKSLARLDGMNLYLPAWKARQVEQSLPYGWCCSVPA